jgi:hypothetical protein
MMLLDEANGITGKVVHTPQDFFAESCKFSGVVDIYIHPPKQQRKPELETYVG